MGRIAARAITDLILDRRQDANRIDSDGTLGAVLRQFSSVFVPVTVSDRIQLTERTLTDDMVTVKSDVLNWLCDPVWKCNPLAMQNVACSVLRRTDA